MVQSTVEQEERKGTHVTKGFVRTLAKQRKQYWALCNQWGCGIYVADREHVRRGEVRGRRQSGVMRENKCRQNQKVVLCKKALKR